MKDEKRRRVKAILKTLEELRYSHCRAAKTVRTAEADYLLTERFQGRPEEWPEFEKGRTWGGRDRHYWFYTEVSLPEDYSGNPAVLFLNTGASDIWNTDNPQVIAYIDGKMTATLDMNHNSLLLTDRAKAGQTYKAAFYAYSNSEGLTNFFEVKTAILHREVERLYYDGKVLWEAADLLEPEDPERIRIFDLLNRCASLLDLRKPGSREFYESVKAADEAMKSEGFGRESLSPATVHSVGHTHIDVAWKWPLRQTRQKAVRSFLTALNLMEQYPEYQFMSSQPQLYEFVKEEAPGLYERMRERIRQGRWETEGAMWLEADCNLISGESMIRQILYGKQFFKEEFGTGDDEVLWLPDVFGYSAAMPQILQKSGIRYFMTTKIGWNEYNRIPNDTMIWRGIDGTGILTYFITTRDYAPGSGEKSLGFATTYNGLQNVSQVMGTWQRYQNKDLNSDVLTCYGYGDGGGGPTAAMLEESRRMELGAGRCPKTRQTSVKDYFHLLEKNLQGKKIPEWSGELYLEFHRGTYTSMARNKKDNRECEFLAQDAEFFCTAAGALEKNWHYPYEALKKAWKLILLNQFHDILPGSSIREVYEDSRRQYETVRELLGAETERAKEALLSGLGCRQEGTGGDSLAVFNQLSFERSGLVRIEGASSRVKGLPVQKTWDGAELYLAEGLKPKGVLVLPGSERTSAAPPVAENIKEEEGRLASLETPYYRLRFNRTGSFSSLWDKEEEREVLEKGGEGNRLLVFEDRPEEYDAWNIDAYYTEKQWVMDDTELFCLAENGPVRACIRVKRRFLDSFLEQEICLYRHTRRIDFKTRVDWREHQLLLKTEFPVDILAGKASYEIQFGNVERPTHSNTSWDEARFEVCAHKWADLSECGYGAALLNDCKYGCDIHGSVMRLTLIKSGVFPNPDADQGPHEFTYSFYPHRGGFREGGVIREAYDLNCPPGGCLVKGGGAGFSYLSIDAENVLADTVKQAEDGEGVIIRFYEAFGKRTKTRVSLPFFENGEAAECDCLERLLREWKPFSGELEFTVKPYEIRTIRVRKRKERKI